MLQHLCLSVFTFQEYQLLLWESDEFQVHSGLFCDKIQLFSDGNETAFSFQFVVLVFQKLNILLYKEQWQIVVIKPQSELLLWESFLMFLWNLNASLAVPGLSSLLAFLFSLGLW